MKTNFTNKFCLILTVAILFLTGQKVNAAELITNGGFENATAFQGWTTQNSVNPWIGWQNGGPGAGGGYTSVAVTSTAPGGGTKNVWNGMTDFTSNTNWQMYQNFTVPAGRSIRVTWHDRYQINHTQFCPGGTCQPKHYYVEVTNSTGTTIIQELHHQQTIGNVNQATGWVLHSVGLDGTGGQTLRLRFRGTETIALSGPGQLEIDNVSVQDLAPTAANVTVGGRITSAGGRGVRNALVRLVDATGNIRQTVTGPYGYYRFEEVASGQTCIISVASRRFVFSSPSQIISVNDQLTDINFVADTN